MNEEIQKQNKLIAVYGRVSSSNQENEGTIETQLSAVNEFAKANGYLIVQKYLDEGWSGDNIIRPSLDQLRIDAKKKIWQAVLIYDPDRLARRYSYQELVMDELREAGIEVLFVTRPTPKDSIEKLLYGVQGIFSEYERVKIAERFRLGKVRKANEGHIIASEAPFGYSFIKKNGKRGDNGFIEGHYEINEREAQIVKNLFSWVVDEGLTLRGIVKRLQELAIPPRKSRRGVWSTSTLSTLLRNRTYIGEGHYGASYAVIPENPLKKEGYKKVKKTSRKMRPEAEWIIISTPKIIEVDLFERVQKRLKSNFEMSARNKKNEYLLAGKIWCICGSRRAGEGPQRGKHLYYRCGQRVRNFPIATTCTEKGLNARITDDLVWNKVASLMRSPEQLIKQAERWLNNQNNKTASSTIDIEQTKREISKLKGQQERYAKAYGAGIITIEQLKEYSLPIKDEIFSFETQIAKARTENESICKESLPLAGEIEEFAQKASDLIKDLSFQAKQEIVSNIVEKVVGNHNQLIVSGYIPVNHLNHVTYCSSNRHRRPSKCRQIDTF